MIRNKTTGLYLSYSGDSSISQKSYGYYGYCQTFKIEGSEQSYYEIIPTTNQDRSVEVQELGTSVRHNLGKETK